MLPRLALLRQRAGFGHGACRPEIAFRQQASLSPRGYEAAIVRTSFVMPGACAADKAVTSVHSGWRQRRPGLTEAVRPGVVTFVDGREAAAPLKAAPVQ